MLKLPALLTTTMLLIGCDSRPSDTGGDRSDELEHCRVAAFDDQQRCRNTDGTFANEECCLIARVDYTAAAEAGSPLEDQSLNQFDDSAPFSVLDLRLPAEGFSLGVSMNPGASVTLSELDVPQPEGARLVRITPDLDIDEDSCTITVTRQADGESADIFIENVGT